MSLTVHTAFISVLVVLFVSGCATQGTKEVTIMESYYQVLEETEPGNMELMKPGMKNQEETIQRFVDFYSVFSAERIMDGAFAISGLRSCRDRFAVTSDHA